MDIIYLLNVLWRKKWIIIAVPAIAVIAAYFFTFSLKPEYKASTQIATGFTTNEGVSITNEKFNLRGVDVKFSNLLASMKSGTIINMVTYRVALSTLDTISSSTAKLKQFSPSDLKRARNLLKSKLENLKTITVNDPNFEITRDILNSLGYTFGKFNAGFNINRIKNTDYIEVSFTSHNPNLSATAVNTYCDEFLRYYVSSKKESSSESVTFIRDLMKRKKEELDSKTAALQNFKENNNLVMSNPGNEAQVGQVYALEEQRDEINNILYGYRLKLNNLKNSLAEKTGGVGSSGKSPNQRLLELKKKIDALNSRFINSGSNNPELLDSLTLLREQYKVELSMMDPGSGTDIGGSSGLTPSEIRESIRNTEIEIQVEESKLKRVNEKLAVLRGKLSGFSKKEAILNTLERDVEVASDEYLAAVEKYNEAQNKLLEASGNIRQVYKAAPPASPESSKKVLILALAGIASLGLTVFVIIVLEVADSSIKTTEQYNRKVGLPLAGTLIEIDTKKLNFPALFSKKFEDKRLELFKHFLRKIRFEIENSQAQAFLVTSPKTGEGKTFFIFSLAFVLSLVKKKVLIIDTNFKNNALTKWLVTQKKNQKYIDERSSAYGELQIVNGSTVDGESGEQTKNRDFVSATKYKNIFIIGNSGGYDSPEEIFHNKDFKSLIAALKKEYDYILMEGPSLNDFSDSKELIKYIDKVIPVFSAETSIKQMDKESIEFMKSLNGKLTGAVLNKVDVKNLNI